MRTGAALKLPHMNSVSRAIKLLIGKQLRKIQGDDNTPCEYKGEDRAEHIEQRCVIKLFTFLCLDLLRIKRIVFVVHKMMRIRILTVEVTDTLLMMHDKIYNNTEPNI